jgi:hypothetical protein
MEQCNSEKQDCSPGRQANESQPEPGRAHRAGGASLPGVLMGRHSGALVHLLGGLGDCLKIWWPSTRADFSVQAVAGPSTLTTAGP